MAENSLHFELVSPERLLISEAVASVTVPGSDGYFTVLRDHAPFMTTMKPGVVEITSEASELSRIFVRGGFADVGASGLTLLAEDAIPLAQVDGDALAQDIQNTQEDIADSTDDEKRSVAETHLRNLLDVQKAVEAEV